MKVSDLNQKTKIDPYLNQAQRAQTIQRQRETQPQAINDQTRTQDRLDISARSRMLQKASDVNAASGAERNQKVQEITSQIQTNTYNINSAKVAEAMMKDLIKDLG
ncbi:MAG: flagellar biosynthesis anti-sigma factor FlgM [Dissulfurimicrobium sp.]|uniref:flagellar biosynthesis anti-sigma factor FlgM n=1 Tax=Dissulfurimicrobium sp. TaxID=2022436 RepID=UPI00404B0B6C